MNAPERERTPFPVRAFLLTALVNAVWINASEVFRYFVFVMEGMRAALPTVPDVAPMSTGVFAIWGIWDTLLLFTVTGFVWLFLERFGRGFRSALLAGTLVWAGVFGLFWLGLYNMNLATPAVLGVALPLAWFELVVAALIVSWGMRRFVVSDESDASDGRES